MKKFLAMMLALVMALSLVACGEQGDSQKGDDSHLYLFHHYME